MKLDERWGEVVTAVIQLKKDEIIEENEIIDFCKEKMAGYKKPKYIVFVDTIPLTGAGKISYEKIKEIAITAVLEKDAALK